jgi:mRNA interferase MazF
LGRKNKRKQSAYYRRLKTDPKKLISGSSVCFEGGEHTDQAASQSVSAPMPHRGEIWFAEFGAHPGTSVQEGCRPALIVSNDMSNQYSETITVVPMTTKMKKTHLPTHVTVSQKDVDTATGQYLERSMALGEQVTTIGKCELIRYVGKIYSRKLKEVEAAVLAQIDINSAAVTTDDTGNSNNFKKEEQISYGS